MKYCLNYAEVNHRNVTLQSLFELFPGWQISVQHFESDQRLTLEGLKGRLESSSYCPPQDHPNYAPLMEGVSELFEKYNRSGSIRLMHDCVAYYLERRSPSQ
jgi:hypothetical protein